MSTILTHPYEKIQRKKKKISSRSQEMRRKFKKKHLIEALTYKYCFFFLGGGG